MSWTCESLSLLDALLPEIFPIISSHLPLCTQPSTLLALALSCRKLKEVVVPHLLYQQVHLRGEKCAIQVLSALKIETIEQAQANEPPLAHHIRRLFISAELSKYARWSKIDAVGQLHVLINLGGLPNLVSLNLHMGRGWYVDNRYQPIWDSRRLDVSFWRSLRDNCPRLTEISLTGVMDWRDNRWVEDSGLYEYRELKSFRLQYARHFSGDPESDDSHPMVALRKLFENLTTFSPYLRTLALHLETDVMDVTADNGLFTLHFPHLDTLTLENFTAERPDVASKFWVRHPNLERVELSNITGRWFDKSSTTLPKLGVFKGCFDDVRGLVPCLGDQLVNLTITTSINAQVPYLLRSLLPNGLLLLRSLGIYQRASNHSREILWEGNRWREDEDGNVSEVSKRKAATFIDAAYITSVARAVPNLEELELVGKCRPPIASALSKFSNLKRLYIRGDIDGPYSTFFPKDMQYALLGEARKIAQFSSSMESITHMSQSLYLRVKIQRTPDDDFVLSVESGCGRMIGWEDTAFPGLL